MSFFEIPWASASGSMKQSDDTSKAIATILVAKSENRPDNKLTILIELIEDMITGTRETSLRLSLRYLQRYFCSDIYMQ